MAASVFEFGLDHKTWFVTRYEVQMHNFFSTLCRSKVLFPYHDGISAFSIPVVLQKQEVLLL